MTNRLDDQDPSSSGVPLEIFTPPWWLRGSGQLPEPTPKEKGVPRTRHTGERPDGSGSANRRALSPVHDAPKAHALVERVRQTIRERHYSRRTEKSYTGWVRRFLAFHHYADADHMGATEVRAYLTHLATERHVSASTQNQCFSALLFLFRGVLGRSLEHLEDTPRA